MDKDMAEIYANTFHFCCKMCENTFSRDEVRAVEDEVGTQFICDHCHSLEINMGCEETE